MLYRFILSAVVLIICSFSSSEEMKAIIAYSNGELIEITEDNREALFGREGFLQKDMFISNGIKFNISYKDTGTGTGFDDPTLGAQRKDVLRRVLEYVASVLNTPGGVVDINVSSINQDISILATCGPIITWTTPVVGGINNGCAFQHLLNGSVDPNGSSYPDIQLKVNWYHDYYLGTGMPPSNQHDLQSLLLHEITHGLGFTSALAYNDSECTGRNRDTGTGWTGSQPDIYTSFDTFLITGNGNYFINSNFYYVGEDSYFIGGDNGVCLNAPNVVSVYGSRPPIYAPSTYICGSSLSHWDDDLYWVMNPYLSAGVVRRSYTAPEIAFLKDIGYVNAGLSINEGLTEGEGGGTVEGSIEGEGEGTVEGSIEGEGGGTVEGSIEGDKEGTIEGGIVGLIEGEQEGAGSEDDDDEEEEEQGLCGCGSKSGGQIDLIKYIADIVFIGVLVVIMSGMRRGK